MSARSATAWLCAAALLACSEEAPPPAPSEPAPASDLEVYRARVATDPADADAWFHLADAFERAALFEDEADALRRVVALRPEMTWAHVKLGTTYNRLGRWREAVESFERARPEADRQPVLHNNLAIAYGKLGRSADEIASLRRAIALRPRYAVARHNLGVALLARGDRAGAREQVEALHAFDEGAASSLARAVDANRGGRP
jgi:tetratricopeptide (TPR) repeat protein